MEKADERERARKSEDKDRWNKCNSVESGPMTIEDGPKMDGNNPKGQLGPKLSKSNIKPSNPISNHPDILHELFQNLQ